MAEENIHSCLICAVPSTPKFKVDHTGKLTRIKGTGTGNNVDSDTTQSSTDSVKNLMEQQLTVDFIVNNLLGVPDTKWSEQFDNELIQGTVAGNNITVSFCDSCEKLVQLCYRWCRQIELAKVAASLLTGAKTKFKNWIVDSEIKSQFESGGNPFWKFIRNEVFFSGNSDESNKNATMNIGISAPVIIAPLSIPLAPPPGKGPDTSLLLPNINSSLDKADGSNNKVTNDKDNVLTSPMSPPSPSNNSKVEEGQSDENEVEILPTPVKPPPVVITIADDLDNDNTPKRPNGRKNPRASTGSAQKRPSQQSPGEIQLPLTRANLARLNYQQATLVATNQFDRSLNYNSPLRSPSPQPMTRYSQPNSTRNEVQERRMSNPYSNLPPPTNNMLSKQVTNEAPPVLRDEQIPRSLLHGGEYRTLTENELSRFSPKFAASVRNVYVHTCSQCSAFFENHSHYSGHVSDHLNVALVRKKKNQSRFCDKCGWFVKNRLMDDHDKIFHEKQPTKKVTPAPAPRPRVTVTRDQSAQPYFQSAPNFHSSNDSKPFDVRIATDEDVRYFHATAFSKYFGRVVHKCKFCPGMYLSEYEYNQSYHYQLHSVREIGNTAVCPKCGWRICKNDAVAHDIEFHTEPEYWAF